MPAGAWAALPGEQPRAALPAWVPGMLARAAVPGEQPGLLAQAAQAMRAVLGQAGGAVHMGVANRAPLDDASDEDDGEDDGEDVPDAPVQAAVGARWHGGRNVPARYRRRR